MTAAVAAAGGVPGTVYLIHFDRRYKHAGHYIGWAKDLAARLAEHARGQGARLMAVIREAGIGWQLARTWPGGRARERQLKNRHGASRFCPLCGVRPRRPATPPAPAPVPPPRPALPRPPRVPAAERGAARARALVGEQLAAGQDPAQIAAVQAAMFRDYDPATARPAAREWHDGYQQAAATLLAAAPAGHPAVAA